MIDIFANYDEYQFDLLKYQHSLLKIGKNYYLDYQKS